MNYIKIYRFEDAPEELKMLSTNGGDEDWIAVIPPSLQDENIPWLEEGTSFGYSCVEEHMLENGDKVLIGCHA